MREYRWFNVPVNRKILVAYLVLAGLYAISALISPSFRTFVNFKHLLLQTTPLIIVGVAQSLVMLSGGVDLSVGAIMSLANVVAVQSWKGMGNIGFIYLFLIPLGLGALAGGINGLLIGKRNLPPIIVTLATSSIFWGFALLLMPTPGGSMPPSLALILAGGSLVPTIIFCSLVFLVTFFLQFTEAGRGIYVVGSGEEVARLLGINIIRVKVYTYALAGLITSLAGIFMAARMFSGDPMVGQPYVLDSMAVAVIGGTSVNGGEGGVLGVIGAAFIFNLLNNILNMLGVSTFYQFVAKGIIVIAAVAITQGSSLIKDQNKTLS